MSFEETRATISECFVYKVPPRTRAEGYKAADWDLSHHMWTGQAIVKSKGSVCIVRLEGLDGSLFAQCQWDQKGVSAVEKVLDSSRYFVLRIEHQGRHAFVGLGFNERSHAFDFNVAITDHKRDLEREQEVAAMKQAARNEPQLDFSFKEGEKITINVKPVGGADSSSSKRSGRRAQGGGVAVTGGGMLAPPPSAKTSIAGRRGQSPPQQQMPPQQQQFQQQQFQQQPFQQQQTMPFGQPQQQQQQQQPQQNSNWFA